VDSFVGAALVAAGSGLAFIAYKHPSGYKRLSAIISLIYGFVATVFLTWWFAIMSASSVVKLVIDPEQHKRIDTAFASITPSALVPWGMVGFILFVWALELLPIFTKDDGKKD